MLAAAPSGEHGSSPAARRTQGSAVQAELSPGFACREDSAICHPSQPQQLCPLPGRDAVSSGELPGKFLVGLFYLLLSPI